LEFEKSKKSVEGFLSSCKLYMYIYKPLSWFIYLTKPYSAISVYFYMNMFINYSTLTAFCATLNMGQKFCKNQQANF